MRTLILIAGAALALAGCRNNDQVDNTTNIDENLTAENVVSNDVTAIDAVTGADANMAADVNYTDLSVNNETSDASNAPAETAAPQPKSKPTSAPAKLPPASPTAAVTNNSAG